jgi:hypothetical protein
MHGQFWAIWLLKNSSQAMSEYSYCENVYPTFALWRWKFARIFTEDSNEIDPEFNLFSNKSARMFLIFPSPNFHGFPIERGFRLSGRCIVPTTKIWYTRYVDCWHHGSYWGSRPARLSWLTDWTLFARMSFEKTTTNLQVWLQISDRR